MTNPGLYIAHLEACIVVATADCDSVLELGCGTGNKLALCQGTKREGIDAHSRYIQLARNRWGRRIQVEVAEAVQFVTAARRNHAVWDAIMMIDFIEHLPKADGAMLLRCCKQMARHRIVVYCPEGECPQERDTYDLGGEQWQTHRAAWTAEDLAALDYNVARWVDRRGPGQHALFATWNQP